MDQSAPTDSAGTSQPASRRRARWRFPLLVSLACLGGFSAAAAAITLDHWVRLPGCEATSTGI